MGRIMAMLLSAPVHLITEIRIGLVLVLVLMLMCELRRGRISRMSLGRKEVLIVTKERSLRPVGENTGRIERSGAMRLSRAFWMRIRRNLRS